MRGICSHDIPSVPASIAWLALRFVAPNTRNQPQDRKRRGRRVLDDVGHRQRPVARFADEERNASDGRGAADQGAEGLPDKGEDHEDDAEDLEDELLLCFLLGLFADIFNVLHAADGLGELQDGHGVGDDRVGGRAIVGPVVVEGQPHAEVGREERRAQSGDVAQGRLDELLRVADVDRIIGGLLRVVQLLAVEFPAGHMAEARSYVARIRADVVGRFVAKRHPRRVDARLGGERVKEALVVDEVEADGPPGGRVPDVRHAEAGIFRLIAAGVCPVAVKVLEPGALAQLHEVVDARLDLLLGPLLVPAELVVVVLRVGLKQRQAVEELRVENVHREEVDTPGVERVGRIRETVQGAGVLVGAAGGNVVAGFVVGAVAVLIVRVRLEVNGPVGRTPKVEALDPVDAAGLDGAVHVGHPIHRSGVPVQENIRVRLLVDVRLDDGVVAVALEDVVDLGVGNVAPRGRTRGGRGHGVSPISGIGAKGAGAGRIVHAETSAVTGDAND